MKRLICAVLVFVMVFCNVSVCRAEEQADDIVETSTELFLARATGRFSINAKAQGSHVVENVLSLEAGETVRINATYSPASASIYIGLVNENGKFYYTRATNGQIDITLEIEKRGNYRLAVVNNSANSVGILGYIYY